MSLLDDIREFFDTEEPTLMFDRDESLVDRELQISAVALLLEAALGDEEFHPEEKKAIREGVEREFGLTPDATKRLMQLANDERMKRIGIESFIKAVAEKYSVEQRETILRLVHRVIEADGKVVGFEGVLYDFLRTKLGLAEVSGE